MGTAAARASKPAKTLAIDRSSRVPFYQQSYSAIRLAIEDGTFPAGSALPSLTNLTADLGISRKTVRRAVQQLLEEGHLAGEINTGLRVPELATVAVEAVPATPEAEKILAPVVRPPDPPPVLFNRRSILEHIDLTRLRAPGELRPFRPGLPQP